MRCILCYKKVILTNLLLCFSTFRWKFYLFHRTIELFKNFTFESTEPKRFPIRNSYKISKIFLAKKPHTRPTPLHTHKPIVRTHVQPRHPSFTYTHALITHLHGVFTGVVDGWCDFYRAGPGNGSFSTSTTSRTHTTAFSRRHISGVTSGKILITRSGFCARVGNEAWRLRRHKHRFWTRMVAYLLFFL